MEKYELDTKITELSKTILSFCISRTSNHHDADDLTQDIIVELYKSIHNIRDDKAFFGFMWSVADNVYKQWYKKKLKICRSELTDDVDSGTDDFSKVFEDNSDIYLLRRELSLLSEKYRCAAILYYLENKSCSEISRILEISESMVKYLLFKSRKILREGMNMERTYGEQSYNPKQLYLMYMGEGPNQFWNLVYNNKIRQNILWACYNDMLNEDEISLQIGVALPYIESDIKILSDTGLLLADGNKYKTNIIILSKDFNNETASKIEVMQNEIAETVYSGIKSCEKQIRETGFYGCNMSNNTYLWQFTCFTLRHAFSKFDEFEDRMPTTAFGEKAFIWGEEEHHGSFAICKINGINFMDWIDKPKGDHHDFYGNDKLAEIFISTAKSEVKNPDEYQKEMLAILVKKGYIIKKDNEFKVTVPVFTKSEYKQIEAILNPVINEVNKKSREIHNASEKILRNYTPPHLKKSIDVIACMHLFEDAISAPVRIMHRKDYLKTDWDANEMPTTYIILNK